MNAEHPSSSRSDEYLEELLIFDILRQVNKSGNASFHDSLLRTGSPLRASRSTTQFFEGRGLFESDLDGSFEGTVDTDQGVKYLSGFNAEGVPPNARAVCSSLENQIRRAFDAKPAEEALNIIGILWNMAEKTCELAAARSRLLLAKLPQLQSSTLPNWFETSINEWDDDDREVLNPASLSATKKLVSCIAHQLPGLTAEVTVGLLGRVTLDWYNLPTRCSWMIEPTDLPFPSVRIYEARITALGNAETRIIHDAHTAIETLKCLANESDGK